MAEGVVDSAQTEGQGERLDAGAYEVIRKRLNSQAELLRDRQKSLNDARKQVFGTIETKLEATEHLATSNNCTPQCIFSLGRRLLLGYNVQLGLRSETTLADVFSIYRFEDGKFKEESLESIQDPQFLNDFQSLFKYYKNTLFARFWQSGPHLFFKFRTGKSVNDFKTFKWLIRGESLKYLDNRSDHEFRYPPQHEFEWTRTRREMHRSGVHPHISIEDRVFVETIGGDLTIKVEDNTASGAGIYTEPVENADQTLDDAEIFYARVGPVILLKIRPYQEKKFRYLVFNEKLDEVRRIDAIADACQLLPEDQGLIFSNGYYLLSGEYKLFDHEVQEVMFDRRIAAPNGEDYLYVFYNRMQGIYVLLFYNIILQKVAPPIICNGYSLFEDGKLIYFKSEDEPRKLHSLQLWSTPFVAQGFEPSAGKEHPLYKLGNKAIVKVLAEIQEVLNLVGKEDSYAGLFLEIVRRTTSLLDGIFWIRDPGAEGIGEALEQLGGTAKAAIEEFEKVQQIRRTTKAETERLEARVKALHSAIQHGRFAELGEFVARLAENRSLRGELIGARELRYVNLPMLSELEGKVALHNQKLSADCLKFLLGESALIPYQVKLAELEKGIGTLERAARAKELEDSQAKLGSELELLTSIVSNLKIEDATQTTRIIDGISTLYGELNRIKAALKSRKRELGQAEGIAEFTAQMKLIGQAVLNDLDVCDVPAKCETYLTKTMVQVEELEGKFSDFPEFIDQIAAKREEIYNAFESRRLQLVEARNRRADAIASAAERILTGIRNRVANLQSAVEINSCFAGDLMVDKLRDLVRQLLELEDTVKAENLESRLKAAREEALRQLKDRKELYAEGPGLIKLGRHSFTVNTQPLALTMVRRGQEMFFHLTGTNFFELVEDPEFMTTSPFWESELPSENAEVCRAEYLAYQMLEANLAKDLVTTVPVAGVVPDPQALLEQVLPIVQDFMSPRYEESYSKGVHDRDAAAILIQLWRFRQGLGLLSFPPETRACARLYAAHVASQEEFSLLERSAKTLGPLFELLPNLSKVRALVVALSGRIRAWLERDPRFAPESADEAAHYLFAQLVGGNPHPVSHEAGELLAGFQQFTRPRNHWESLRQNLAQLEAQPLEAFAVARDWAGAYIEAQAPGRARFRDELALLLLQPQFERQSLSEVPSQMLLQSLKSDHPRIRGGQLELDFHEFRSRLGSFAADFVPRYRQYMAMKRQLTEQFRRRLRLEEFAPRILSSFVRNQLIDRVYLPLIGDNLAKQIGAAGDSKRTDRMGMLLLLSPPGYGKTTLMEYVANRLGLIFMKINGPALGHEVTAIDPGAAPNASAREELEKLNLALEMGDNLMLYIDDIQHCNPEFLQKFISLCDAQRKIEGVYRGRTRTYDLRGKKVCVCMAGNPYTESGTRFQIPDMLANRADTYNLGDILSGHEESFRLSYIENGLTSNQVLQRLANKSHKDVLTLVKIAQGGEAEGAVFEAEHTSAERNEYLAVLSKLLRARDVILAVNMAYIRSAAQEDAYRTEPPFKLQGSYRNMNKIAEKIHPILNDEELEQLIRGHYENEAQTLTAGAEANLLRFYELMGSRSEKDEARWQEIVTAFRKRQSLFGVDAQDRVGQVVLQLGAFGQQLGGIQTALGQVASCFESAQSYLARQGKAPLEVRAELGEQTFVPLTRAVEELRVRMEQALQEIPKAPPPSAEEAAIKTGNQEEKEKEIRRLMTYFAKLLSQQFEIMKSWLQPMAEAEREQNEKITQLQTAMEAAYKTQRHIWHKLQKLAPQ